jgi:release factor glutamine methyltransferase
VTLSAGRPVRGAARGAPLVEHLTAAERALATAGVADARREALALWAGLAGTSPGAAWAARARAVAPDTGRAFAAAVARRARGAPLAYATGTAAFRSLELAVDPRVLIPRPETEGLVEHVLRWCRQQGRWGVVVDVGTGSGCIALSLASEGAFDRVIATDISEAAVVVAARNAALVAPRTPVEFRVGDLLWAIGPDQVDVVVSNPPYVTAGEWTGLDPGVRDHEPRVALVAGADGLTHTRSLLRHARSRLREGGLLALEVDCRRAAQALASARACGWPSARIEPDLFGRARYLLATRET